MPELFSSPLKMCLSPSYLMICLSKVSSSSSNLYFSSSFTRLVIVSSFWLMFSSTIFEERRLDWFAWLIQVLWFWFWTLFWFFGRPISVWLTMGLWLYKTDDTDRVDETDNGWSCWTGDWLVFYQFCKICIHIVRSLAFFFEMNGSGNPLTLNTVWISLIIWIDNDSHNDLAHGSHDCKYLCICPLTLISTLISHHAFLLIESG